MDIEFHYYVTYLIALQAGFDKKSANIIATSSQLVDDNVEINYIKNNKDETYKTYISQTANILKPEDELFRIYPVFHFVPGDYDQVGARRKDGTYHILNTTPNSLNAQRIIKNAAKANNLYRLGIASHCYVDTWAHQNFVGYFSYFNGMSGVLNEAIPDIGHADAKHNPDLVSKVWKDERLISENEIVDNNERFIEAAIFLLKYYKNFLGKSKTISKKFINKLKEVFSIKGCSQEDINRRINKYKLLSEGLFNCKIDDYYRYEWFFKGVEQRYNKSYFLPNMNISRDEYYWKNKNYKSSKYYQFSQAVKSHQSEVMEIFDRNKYNTLELKRI
ncbi:MAG: DUF6765 family protein [Bacillota bacterium]